MQYKKYTRGERGARSGFTLVEALVAITILLMVVVGTMTIATRGMKMGFYANEQTTAVYLAQEGIEWVQKLRDDVALDNYQDFKVDGPDGDGDTWDWFTSLSSSCVSSAGCDVDFNFLTAPKNCSTLSSCRLNMDTDALSALGDRVYGYSSGPGWVSSPYTRIIQVGAITDGGVPVTVTVSWDSYLTGSLEHKEVTLQSWVYDQYERFE